MGSALCSAVTRSCPASSGRLEDAIDDAEKSRKKHDELGAGTTRRPVSFNSKILMSAEYGAPRETRTPDPLITNQMLYQLSYKGSGRAISIFCRRFKKKAPMTGRHEVSGRRAIDGAGLYTVA